MKLNRNYVTPIIIILNWRGLKGQFKKGVFLPAVLGILTASVILIVSEIMTPPIDIVIVNKIVKAPVNDAFKALGINYGEVSKKLKENGILIEKATTIEDIWINNSTDSKK